MKKGIARLVTRAANDQDGLIVGGLTQNGIDELEPYTVYELVLDTDSQRIVLTKVGKSCGRTEMDSTDSFLWVEDLGYLLDTVGNSIFMTKEELEKNKVD